MRLEPEAAHPQAGLASVLAAPYTAALRPPAGYADARHKRSA